MRGLNDTISGLIGDFVNLSPEIVLIVGAIGLIIVQLLQDSEKYQLKWTVSLATLALSGWMVACCRMEGAWMNDLLWHDGTTPLLKYFMLLVTAAVLAFSNTKELIKRGEYHFLIIMIVLGSFMVMQSANLLVFYLSVELISITSYVLVSFNFTTRSFEAGIKYLLFGAMASGLMLYGISLLYGLTGSLDIAVFSSVFSAEGATSLWLIIAIVFFLFGLLFKLAMVPMHIWAPDAYEAGPTPVIALISVLPKIAILVFFMQFVELSSMELISFDWKAVLSVLAILSMFFGNLSALRQDNLKRMLAYSSIAHSGFLILGIISGTVLGYKAMLFYLIVYGLMNLGAFYFASLMEKNGIDKVSGLSGMGRSNPMIAVTMVVVMIALVGLPPTAGFSAKLLIFSSVYELFNAQGDSYLMWLFGLGIMNAAISLFYYLKVPYYMIVKEGDSRKFSVSQKDVAFMGVLSIILLWLFFQADLLFNILNPANFAF